MSGNVTKNKYFTYMSDGNTDAMHRSAVQVWNINHAGAAYSIYTGGTNPQNGRYNAFCKKHLLTYAGGNAAARGDEEPGDGIARKMSKIHSNRQFENIDEYTAGRKEKQQALDVGNQADYEINALGAKDENSPNTVVLCDDLTPEQLKRAFLSAILKANDAAQWVTGQARHVVVGFSKECVLSHDYMTNGITRKKKIRVTAYCEQWGFNDRKFHIVHCSGAAD